MSEAVRTETAHPRGTISMRAPPRPCSNAFIGEAQGAGEPIDLEAISPFMSCRVSYSGPLNIDKATWGLN